MASSTISKLAIHSVPRSGSSWLGEIVNSHPAVNYNFQPLFSYAFKSALDDDTSQADIRRFFSDVAASQDPFITQQEGRAKGIKPNFVKQGEARVVAYKEVRYHYILEHALKTVPEFKCVGLVRCPFAALSSFKQAPREFRADLGWDFEREWRFAQSKNENRREDYFGYEKWKETAQVFLRLKEQFPDRMHLVNYNALISDTVSQVEALFAFIGLDVPPQTRAFIEADLHEQPEQGVDTYSVFNARSTDTGWQGKLSEQTLHYIYNDLKSSPLAAFFSQACP